MIAVHGDSNYLRILWLIVLFFNAESFSLAMLFVGTKACSTAGK
ncbi:MAG: hypothetical protein ACREP3_00750 [Candidatus Binatia bacterium]